MKGTIFLKRLEIEGFRGVNNPILVEFQKPVVLIFGDNFSGKSSIVGAIEWCLFDKLKFIEYESKKEEEIVNDFHPLKIATVKLILSDSKGREFIVTRSRKKDIKKSDFVIQCDAGKYDGKKAENFKFSLIGLTLDDFLRTIFLHQEAIRSVLTEKMTERSKGMDKLLGLEDFSNISEIIGKAIGEIEDKIKDLGKKEEGLRNKIEGAYETLDSEIEKRKKELRERKIKEDEIDFSYCLEKLKEVKKEMLKLDKDTTERYFPTYEAAIESIKKNLPLIKRCITKCKNKISETFRFDELENKKEMINDLKMQIESILKKEEKLQKDYENSLKPYESKESIQHHLKEVKDLIQKKEIEMKNIDIIYKILTDVYGYYIQNIDEKNCIVCKQPIKYEELKKLLEARLQELEISKGKELQKIKEIKQKYEEEQISLKKKLEKIEEIEKEKSTLEGDKVGLLQQINEQFGTRYKDLFECLKFVEKELRKVKSELNKIKKPLSKKLKILDKQDHTIEIIGNIIGILLMKESKKELEKRYKKEKKEIITIKSKIDKLQDFEDRLKIIRDVLSKYQRDIALGFIGKAQQKVDKIYKKLTNHPYFDHLQIEVIPRERKGIIRNYYNIKVFNKKENKYSLAASRLSLGGMNCVALSLFLSLATTLHTKVNFIILDSPIQELDLLHKRNLAEIIKNLSSKKTFIITTFDQEFKNFLEKRIGRNLQLIHLGKWTPEKGVKIE
jgi:DNA repair exonuclease SbcCD ATPase subunit